MLGQGGFELDRIEFMLESHQRHDGHFRIEVQEDRQASGLKIKIDQSYALIQRLERQCEVGCERGHADTTDQAGDGNDDAAFAPLGAPARFAYLEQRASSLSR